MTSTLPSTPTADAIIEVDAPPTPAFGLAEQLAPHCGAMHQHGRHQLLYAAEGALRLVTEHASWLLPPQRAAWLPAGTLHRTESTRLVALRTVYFDPAFGPSPSERPVVFSVSGLCRELVIGARRWGPTDPATTLGREYFGLLLRLCREWVADALPFRLPVAKSAQLQRAIRWAIEHLDDADMDSAARAGAMSPRTLARKMASETGTSWREFILTARMLAAMEQLAHPEHSVTEVALAVGYDSPAASTRRAATS